MNLTMTGRLCDCALMSFGTPADSVRHLVPDGLELITRGDRALSVSPTITSPTGCWYRP